MNIRGIILEGHSHAGKTSLLRALKRYHASDDNAESSIVVLGEHYSQVLQNVQGKLVRLSREQHLELLGSRVEMLKNLNDWAKYLGPWRRKSRGLFFILERFHLNHRAAFPDHDDAEIAKIEQRLCELGARCVLLTISPEFVKERIQSRNPAAWEGKSSQEIEKGCKALLEAQDALRLQAGKSVIPTREIHTDDMEWDAYARMIMEDSNFI
jgi:ABC-type metal ion transport system, ATPase component